MWRTTFTKKIVRNSCRKGCLYTVKSKHGERKKSGRSRFIKQRNLGTRTKTKIVLAKMLGIVDGNQTISNCIINTRLFYNRVRWFMSYSSHNFAASTIWSIFINKVF